MILKAVIPKNKFKYIVNYLYRCRCLKVKWQDIKDSKTVVLELKVKKTRAGKPAK